MTCSKYEVHLFFWNALTLHACLPSQDLPNQRCKNNTCHQGTHHSQWIQRNLTLTSQKAAKKEPIFPLHDSLRRPSISHIFFHTPSLFFMISVRVHGSSNRKSAVEKPWWNPRKPSTKGGLSIGWIVIVKCPKFEGHLVATHTTYAAHCMCWSKIPCRWIKKKIVRICVSIYIQ